MRFSQGATCERLARFIEVGRLAAGRGLAPTTSTSRTSRPRAREFIAELRERAGRMGCDGIVLGGVTNQASYAHHLSIENKKGLVATCIVYTGAEVSRAPARSMAR